MARRPSAIDRLPSDIRELIGELRTRRGRTIDEILAKLRELDVDIPRSTLARETQRIDAVAKKIRASRGVAEAVMARLEDKPDSRVARMNIELLHALLNDLMAAAQQDDGTIDLDAKQAMFLATTVQKLSSATKAEADAEIRVKRAMKGEVGRKLDAVERELGDGDDKPDMAAALKRIREEVYGIFE